MLSACPFSSDNDDAAFSGLNLVLKLRDPRQMGALLTMILEREDEIRYRMKRMNSVHYARFLPVHDQSALQVITEFDGLLDDYLHDFVIEIGDVFNGILGFVKDAPPLPIQHDPAAFVDFVCRNNLLYLNPLDPRETTVFSAYRRKRVVDIIGADQPEPVEVDWWTAQARRQRIRAEAINAPSPDEDAVDPADLQANILEPLHSRRAVHFALRVTDPARARAFIASLVDGTAIGITSQAAADGASALLGTAPALTIGLTATGLAALGVPPSMVACFPRAFREGPVARAIANRDVATSAPDRWVLGGPDDPVHLLLSLHQAHRPAPPPRGDGSARSMAAARVASFEGAEAIEAFEAARVDLKRRFDDAGLAIVQEQPVELLDSGRFHFGFRDGLSQPLVGNPATRLWGGSVDGPASRAAATATAATPSRSSASEAAANDASAPVGTAPSRIGEFVLGTGFRNAFGASSLGAVPADLGQHGSFGVVRLIGQDCTAYEDMLDRASRQSGLCREFLAAKMLGRWRDGQPLTTEGPPPTCTGHGCVGCPPAPGVGAASTARAAALDDFDFRYRAADGRADADDFDGRVCPLHAHIRRMNPRQGRAPGLPASHRVIRRGLPYGPAWRRGDDEARGLYGLFICGDIERQFEFLQQRWGFDERARPDRIGRGDPLAGATGGKGDGTAAGFDFRLDRREVSLEWTSLVTTRGSLYLFLPGLAALRRIATGDAFAGWASQVAATGKPPAVVAVRPARGPAAPDEPMPTDDPARFNPMHPAFIDDPYPYYAMFRERAPVARIQSGRAYNACWVFSDHWVRRVCADTDAFPKPLSGSPRPGASRAPNPVDRLDRGLFYQDGEKHRCARAAIEPVLAQAIENIEPLARQLAGQALRQIRTREFDAVPTYVDRVPRNVFFALAGVPEARWPDFGDLAGTMLHSYNPMRTPAERSPYVVAARELGALMVQLGPTPRASPLFAGIDLAATGFNAAEALQTQLHFALGGYLSTAFALGTGIRRLLVDPAAREAFESDATRPRVISELLRFEPPFQTAERRAARDIELNGVQILAGETITVVLGAASRDPEQFGPTADQFDPLREPAPAWNDNAAFGHGVHQCIGAALVEKVLPIYLQTWLAAMPSLALSETAPRWVGDPAYRGYASLPMRF